MAPSRAKRFRDSGIGELGFPFKLGSLVVRMASTLFELGALALIAYAYDKWKGDASVRVDIIFPCFFPVSFNLPTCLPQLCWFWFLFSFSSESSQLFHLSNLVQSVCSGLVFLRKKDRMDGRSEGGNGNDGG